MFWRVLHPGWRFALPGIHRIELVRLEDVTSDWQNLSNDELEDRLIFQKFGQDVLNEWIEHNREPKYGGYEYY